MIAVSLTLGMGCAMMAFLPVSGCCGEGEVGCEEGLPSPEMVASKPIRSCPRCWVNAGVDN
eukprot:12886524-Prorocentrum_lima.AAC.1